MNFIERPKCGVITKHGKPCTNRATRQSGRCGKHDLFGELAPRQLVTLRLFPVPDRGEAVVGREDLAVLLHQPGPSAVEAAPA